MSFKNRFSRSLLAAAMENEHEDSAETEAEQDVAVAEAATEVAEGAAEVDAAETEVEQMEGEIEEGLDDVDTLNEVADTLEATEEEGGATQTEARLAEITVESIYAKWNIQTSPFSSMEAFGDKRTRIQATRVSVENIRDTAKKAFEAIKNFLKNLVEKFFALIRMITQHSARVSHRAKKLGEKVASMKDMKNAKKAKLSVNTYKLLVDKTPNPNSAINCVKALIDEVKDLPSDVNVLKAASDVEKLGDIKNNTNILSSFLQSRKDIISLFTNEKVDAKKLFGLKDDENHKWYLLDAFAGRYAVAAKIPVIETENKLKGEYEAELFRKASNATISIVSANTKEVTEEDTKVDSLNKQQAAEMCKIVEQLDNLIKNNSSALKDYEKFTKTQLQNVEKSIANLNEDVKENKNLKDSFINRASSKVIFQILKGQASFMVSYLTKVQSLAVKAANAGLDFVEASIKAQTVEEA